MAEKAFKPHSSKQRVTAILFFINVTKLHKTLQWQVACDAVRPNYDGMKVCNSFPVRFGLSNLPQLNVKHNQYAKAIEASLACFLVARCG